MKNKAVCIRCGNFKKDAFSSCKACDWTPKTDFEAARALILSEQADYAGEIVGKSMEELQTISDSIRSGRPYAIDGEEQSRVVRAYYSYLKTLPPRKWYQSKKVKIILALLLIMLISSTVSYFVLL